MTKQGIILLEYLLHKQKRCNPDDCQFCDDPYLLQKFDDEYNEDIIMGNS